MNLSIGQSKTMPYGNGEEMLTAICKEKVDEAFLAVDGFRGDSVTDLRFHGGVDRAVCVYPFEHYELWEKEFGLKLPSASFGENLTVSNMLESDVCIGDIYQIGDAKIQISQARVPCSTITRRLGQPLLLNRIVETGYTGYLCRVLKEGTVRSDSTIELLERHPKQISVLHTNKIYFHATKDLQAMQELVGIEELAEKWKKKLYDRIEQLS